MTPSFIDSHAHLSEESTFSHVDQVLERAKACGISAVVNICTDAQSLKNGLALAERYPWVYNAASTTPHDAAKEGEALFPFMAEHAHNGSLVAVGETGLDYFHWKDSAEDQKKLLRRYLQLALECHLPVVIHCRDAFADFFEILDQEYVCHGKHAPGVLHCFTGTCEEAEQVLKRGWYLSLSGIVTFKKSTALQAVAKMTPLNQLLIETDSPWLAPQSQRGRTNEPAFLPEIAQCIAHLKGLTLSEVAAATADNARRLFNF